MNVPDPVPTVLMDLAPTRLRLPRGHRFDGSGFEIPLDRFAPADRILLGRIYQAVQGLAVLGKGHPRPSAALAGYLKRVGDGRLLPDVQRLGEATRVGGRDSPATRRVVHDVRGGGLTVLLGTAELLSSMPGDEGLLRTCADAARDHAKIMRNLLPEIDPAARATDEAGKPHGIGHFVDKWDGATVGDRAVRVRVRCTFAGAVSARCLETSSIDRVVYNLVNNAVRFTADGSVTLWVFPVGEDLTRWVVENTVTSDQVAFLSGAAPDLGRLYAGGITRGGTGVGLANCAELVAACFGLDGPEEAIAGRYLGASTQDDAYFAWFHWPTFRPAPRALD